MKNILAKVLIKLAQQDPDLFLLTGDLGFPYFLQFKRLFPERFLNLGVAEQNMIGVASGLSMRGKTVFVYSIVTFATMRCFEQIRDDVAYQNLNVKIIGFGGGFDYGLAGVTHFGWEDIAIMRSLPNMKVYTPWNLKSAQWAIENAYRLSGPAYLRLSQSREKNIEGDNSKIMNNGIQLLDGKDVTIMVIGNIYNQALQARKMLENQGFSVRMISFSQIKPLDEKIIKKAAQETKAIFTVEDHSLIGGFGSAVAEVLAEEKSSVVFKRIALPDVYPKQLGIYQQMREHYGLSANLIFQKIIREYKKLDTLVLKIG